MSRRVIDASVGVKWFFPESGWAEARGLRGKDIEAIVPDSFFGEVGSAVLKKLRRGQVTVAQAAQAMEELRQAPVIAVPVRPYVLGGFHIAREIGESIYDGVYVAVADAHECQVVTADRELVQAVAGTPWEGRVVALGDLPEG